MKKAMLPMYAVTAGLLILACNKDHVLQTPQASPCTNGRQYDTTSMANMLVGTWKFKTWFCGECVNPGWHYPNKDVEVTFTASRTFTLKENAVTVAQGSWYFQSLFSNYWGLRTTSSTDYLNGGILFCDSGVEFSDSYIDGPDNYFEK